MPTNKLSTIISAYNQDELACVHIRECQNSTRIPDEIIIVDDCGEPGLKEKLEKLDIKTKIIYARILPPKIKWNYTGARNLGVWLSKGDYLSIEDNDHIPYKDFYKDALDALKANPEVSRVKTHKRRVVELNDVLKKPIEEWKILGSRPPHQDVCVIKRDLYLKVKGYDERFAGAYGWSATDWKRRLVRTGILTINTSYQYVIASPKTRGLSYRNYQLARTQQGNQSPKGILNFTYIYEILPPNSKDGRSITNFPLQFPPKEGVPA